MVLVVCSASYQFIDIKSFFVLLRRLIFGAQPLELDNSKGLILSGAVLMWSESSVVISPCLMSSGWLSMLVKAILNMVLDSLQCSLHYAASQSQFVFCSVVVRSML